MSEYDRVCEQIKNTRTLLSNAVAMRKRGGVQNLMDELDRLIDRKRHLESGRTIPESRFATQRG